MMQSKFKGLGAAPDAIAREPQLSADYADSLRQETRGHTVSIRFWMGTAVAAACLVLGCHSNAGGFAWFQQPTDTIEASGQTVLGSFCTFEAVIMLPSRSNAFGNIFDEWTDGQEDKRLRIGPDTIVGNAYPPSGEPLRVNTTVAPDAWHHVAFVCDGTTRRLYLDGGLVGSQTNNSPISNASGPGCLGAIFRNSQVQSSFIGYVDSLRISTVCRYTGASFTPTIGDLPNDADTVLLYNFNDPPGITIRDESRLGRIGTLGTSFSGATSPTLVPFPLMSISRSATNCVLTWPDSAAGYRVETTASLTPPLTWTPVTTTPTFVGSQYRLVVPCTGTSRFFRLVKP